MLSPWFETEEGKWVSVDIRPGEHQYFPSGVPLPKEVLKQIPVTTVDETAARIRTANFEALKNNTTKGQVARNETAQAAVILRRKVKGYGSNRIR